MDVQTSLKKEIITYLVTGATGYIGLNTIKMLHKNEKYTQENINIILHCRNRAKYESMYGDMENDKIFPIFCDISDIKETIEKRKQVGCCEKIDYIIHCASNTMSSYMISNPVETIDGIVEGTKSVLELAKELNIKGMVYLSSMEVYGDILCTPGNRATEDMLGYIDILKPRSSYPLGKRMAEGYCAAYANEYGVPVKIARLAQTFGKGILPNENRSFAQFVRAAAEGRDIVLKTEGKSIGNSVSIEDAIDAIFFLLENGENGQAYNVVNERNTMSIKDMAELVARIIGEDKVKVVFDIEDKSKTGYAADTYLYMSGEKMRRLGWEAKKGIEDMFVDVYNSI
ncbi:MAG: NAD(P)-dependent oxidoreductase [Lachnospiraceae bacterium]|nr:NAD(P)-dependent oxidoreductase [Lachnospiraceae bacterium]